MTCVKAVDTGHLPYAAIGVLRGVFERGGDGILRSVKIGLSLRTQLNRIERGSSLCTHGIVAGIIASAPERANRWKMLVKGQLVISEAVLRDYLTHGDSVLLANLIHITRQFLPSNLGGDAQMASALLYILPSISEFNIKDTLPALQHDFCALWNEIALQARESGSYRIYISILKGIRHLYLAIHEGTSASPLEFSASTRDRDPILSNPSSYPSCRITSHRPHPHPVAAVAPPARRDTSASTTDHSHIQHAVLPVTPISESSHQFPVDVDSHRRSSVSFYPATAAATHGVADPLVPVISSTANSISDSVSSQRNADLGVVPYPSTSGSSAPQTGQVTPGRELLPSTSLAAFSRTRQPTSNLRSDITTNSPTRNSDENSLASDLPRSPSSPYPESSVG
ncbi:hypothetical protein BGW80DRAFT_1322153 [Lactifluus volemus]|nr:hypothetical protein BGW80DRAFT_1322153 [Lactifluus volemus]